MNFNNVLIGTDEPEKMVEYYTKLFGEPTWKDESYSGWQIGSGVISIGRHSEVSGRNTHPGRIILNLETKDVKGEFDRLVAAGATVIREPYSFEGYPDAWIATFEDPDGNYFQLMTPMEPPAS